MPSCTGPVHDEGTAVPAEVPGVRPCPDSQGAASGQYRRQRDENTVIPDPAVWLDHADQDVYLKALLVKSAWCWLGYDDQ